MGWPERKDLNKVIHDTLSNVCKGCILYIKIGQVPPNSLANGNWIGNVPCVLQNFSWVEKLLISKVCHNQCVVRADHEYYLQVKVPYPQVFWSPKSILVLSGIQAQGTCTLKYSGTESRYSGTSMGTQTQTEVPTYFHFNSWNKKNFILNIVIT